MMSCHDVQERLADGEALDAAAQSHLDSCEECSAFRIALDDVDVALTDLPPIDAPDALVEQLLSTATEGAPERPRPERGEARRPHRARRFVAWAAGGSSVAALLLVGVTSMMTMGDARVAVSTSPAPVTVEQPILLPDGKSGRLNKKPVTIEPPPEKQRAINDGVKGNAQTELDSLHRDMNEQLRRSGESKEKAQVESRISDLTLSLEKDRRGEGERTKAPDAKNEPKPVGGQTVRRPDDGDDGVVDPDEVQPGYFDELEKRADARVTEKDRARARACQDDSTPVGVRIMVRATIASSGEVVSARMEAPEHRKTSFGRCLVKAVEGWRFPKSEKRELLLPFVFEAKKDQKKSTQGLRFIPANGYWANTYVPGDPLYRTLARRFAGVGIEDAAQPYPQPFDPPRSSAIGVTLSSDQAAVQGETRMLLQVGLKGTNQYGRRRPTMNVALVLDARGPLDTEDAKRLRALVLSFVRARSVGDRLSVFVAGRRPASLPTAELLAPSQLAYGAAAVAVQQVLASDFAAKTLESTLTQATAQAIERVAKLDDKTAPLGTSAVVILTHRSIGRELPQLRSLAGQSAVAGVPVGAIGTGSAIERELEEIALAGQGNRRMLQQAEEAQALVERELSAVARVVARALRLRIRLAPGVKLVEVLGSRRLDAQQTRAVKRAEKSIDLRLARNLGITADRGEDEDGIQILIPSYYAGDEHTILLDVVVPKHGPVADVQVRYKDLVYLDNGVATARYYAPRGRREAGPLQLAVTKNRISQRVADALSRASDALGQNRVAASRQILLAAREEVTRIAGSELATDADVARDLSLLAAYAEAVERRQPVRSSLKFAARAKILPPIHPSLL